MAEVYPTTFTVKGLKGDSYTFRIPSFYDEFTIAAHVKDIRVATDPNWDGYDNGLNYGTTVAMRACATFEAQLSSTSATWVYTTGADQKPVVQSSKFPPDKVSEVLDVFDKYNASVARFRATGSPDEPPPPPKAVESERDQGDAAIQS